MKKKVILSSIVTIALCLALITGSTFALFTSEHDFDIAVTAGKVDISAKFTKMTTSSFDDWTGTNTFELGGTAKLTDNMLTLDRMVPGDAVNLTIDLENVSTNVDFAYKLVLIAEGELAPALTASADMGNGDVVELALGAGTVTGTELSTQEWIFVDLVDDAGNVNTAVLKDVAVTVSFPNDNNHKEQNKFQGKTANIYFQIVAVQGNGTAIYDANPTPRT